MNNMQGKILIVDPIATNRIVLKVKLSASYYNVVQAGSIAEAQNQIEKSGADIVITANQFSDGNACDLINVLRDELKFTDIPVIAIDSENDPKVRVALLSMGVEAILSTPVDETLLLARLRSLTRTRASSSEWRFHEDTSRALGFAEEANVFQKTGRVTLVARDPSEHEVMRNQLMQIPSITVNRAPIGDALDYLASAPSHAAPDIFILIVTPENHQNILQLLATIRSNAQTRHCGVLIVQTEPDAEIGARALDLGANDLISFETSIDELTLRLDALLQHKQVGDQLRATVRSGLKAAVHDPLTGLHNRRYAMPQLNTIAKLSTQSDKPYAVMVADMDHFKRINDTYGHAAGDAVLVETANRLRENLRAVDLIARIGGEEFLIVLPGASLKSARTAARRLCDLISEKPFDLPTGHPPIQATISIGLTIGGAETTGEDTAHLLLDQADRALYRAKNQGRNCVQLNRPAA